MNTIFSLPRGSGKQTMYDAQQIQLAAYVSVAAHSAVGQRRKYTGEPYWMHTHAVAKRVEAAGGTPQQICAAYLHDTVEDTQLTLGEIKGMFGPEVGALVAGLTDVSEPSQGDRVMRRSIDRRHTAEQSAEVKLIKLADCLDNLNSITDHDTGFGRVYWTELSLLAPHLKEGSEALYKELVDLLESTRAALDMDPMKTQKLIQRHLDAEAEIAYNEQA